MGDAFQAVVKIDDDSARGISKLSSTRPGEGLAKWGFTPRRSRHSSTTTPT